MNNLLSDEEATNQLLLYILKQEKALRFLRSRNLILNRGINLRKIRSRRFYTQRHRQNLIKKGQNPITRAIANIWRDLSHTFSWKGIFLFSLLFGLALILERIEFGEEILLSGLLHPLAWKCPGVGMEESLRVWRFREVPLPSLVPLKEFGLEGDLSSMKGDSARSLLIQSSQTHQFFEVLEIFQRLQRIVEVDREFARPSSQPHWLKVNCESRSILLRDYYMIPRAFPIDSPGKPLEEKDEFYVLYRYKSNDHLGLSLYDMEENHLLLCWFSFSHPCGLTVSCFGDFMSLRYMTSNHVTTPMKGAIEQLRHSQEVKKWIQTHQVL